MAAAGVDRPHPHVAVKQARPGGADERAVPDRARRHARAESLMAWPTRAHAGGRAPAGVQRRCGARGRAGRAAAARAATAARRPHPSAAHPVVVVFLVLVGGRAIALASTSDNLDGDRPARSRAHRRAAGSPRRHPRPQRQELAVGQAQQTVFATPYLLQGPQRRPRRSSAPRCGSSGRRRALEKALAAVARAASPTWRARSTRSWRRRPLWRSTSPGVG